MKKIIFVTAIFVSLIACLSLYSQSLDRIFTFNKTFSFLLNQKGENLAKGGVEDAIYFYDPFQFGPDFFITHCLTEPSITATSFLGFIRIAFNSGFQTRFGINDYIENQSKLNNIINFYPGGLIGYVFSYENSFKYSLIKNNNYNFSLLNFIGIEFGGNPLAKEPINSSLDIDTSIITGFKLIGGYKNFYYGFIFMIKNNIWEYITNSKYYNSTPTVGFGLSLGSEVLFKNNVVVRNEISIACDYYNNYRYYYECYYIDSCDLREFNNHVFNISAAYCIAIGWRRIKQSYLDKNE